MLDYDLFKNIENYANRHLESSKDYYISRNQDPDKMFINIFNGKVAEWCNYFSLKDADYIVEKPPCMQIFSQGSKSYDADLVILGKGKEVFEHKKHVHIKSVLKSNYEKYGASFLVQKNDPIVINKPDHHFYSVMLQESLTSYRFYKWLDVSQAIYQPPKQLNLHSKLAVYLN